MATEKKYVSLSKLGLYDEKIKKVIADGDSSTLASANAFAESLASNYDAAGAAKTVQDNLDVEVLRAKAAEEANATAAKKAQDEVDALELVVADKAAQSDLDALEGYVGTIPEGATATDVVGYVIEKTTGIASQGAMTELTNRVGAVEGAIDAIEADYLKAADKTELAGDIADVQAAVDAEKGRAEGIEAGLRTDINTVMGDYLKAADKTELQNNINTVSGAVERLTNGVSAEEIDGVNDLIQYVKDHGTEVTGMQGDISDNAEAISGVAGRMDTAEGKIEDLEGAVATKVEQSVYDQKIASLEGVDTSLGNRISTLEGKFGGADGSVEDMIADAKAEAIEAAASDAASKDAALKTEIETAYKKYADEEDAKIESRVDALETASATHALASDLTTLAGRVTTNEGKIGTLESKMTAVETKAANNETSIGTINTELAKKAAQADLEAAVARIAANEEGLASFVEVSEQEILAMFQA